MALTYEEFKKIAPKETSEFFDILLPYLNKYIGGNNDLHFIGTSYCSGDNGQKSYYLSIYALGQLKEYTAFLGECGYRANVYCLDSANTMNQPTLDALYDKYTDYIVEIESKQIKVPENNEYSRKITFRWFN